MITPSAKPSHFMVWMLILFFGIVPSPAQDSKIMQNLELADSLQNISLYTRAIEIYQKTLDQNNKTLLPLEKARIEERIGNCYSQLGQENIAIGHYMSVLKAGEISDTLLMSDASTGLGICYEITGKHDSAFIHYMNSYTLIEHSPDTMRRARGLRNMAQLLRVMQHYDQARTYCRQAIRLEDGIDDFKILANIYNETAYLYELSDMLDSAKIYYQMLIDISKANGFQKGESVGCSNMASVFERENRYEEALELKLYAIEIDKLINDPYGLMTSYVGLKDPYIKLGEYKKAQQALELALQMCDTAWVVNLSGIHLGLYEIYKYQGNNKKALAAHEAYTRLDKRVRNLKAEEKVSEILIAFETEKKEQQILFLEQTNLSKRRQIRLQWLFIAALFLIASAVFIVGLLLIKNKNQSLVQMETELRSLQLINKQRGSDPHSMQKGEMDQHKNADPDLTTREHEILHYLGQGYSNSAIAEKLFISRNTVKFHIKNIYIKLDVKNRVEALIRSNGKLN